MMRQSIAMRLVMGFTAVVLLSLGLSLYQLYNFHQAMRFLDAVTRHDDQVADALTDIIQTRTLLRSLREGVLADAALAGRVLDANRADVLVRYQDQARLLMEQTLALGRFTAGRSEVGISEERRNLWDRLAVLAKELEARARELTGRGHRLVQALERNDLPGAVRERRELEATQNAMEERIAQARDLVDELGRSGRADIVTGYESTLRASALAIIAMILTGTAAAWVIGRSITGVLGRYVAFVQGVGQGDLTRSLSDQGSGEMARLATHLNGMTWSLREVAAQTRAGAEEMAAATAEIRTSAQQQAAAMSEQLAAIEETSATLTEITHSGAQITERAQEVERSGQAAVQTGEEGLRAVDDAVRAMHSIREQVDEVAHTIVSLSERTQAISEIILTVNAVAERAHLVALNASIEAAAAGEHGRTFSVVAAEIKRLADQARDATGRVRMNLGEIQQGIQKSVLLTEEAGKRVETGRQHTAASAQTVSDLAANLQESVQAFQQIVAAINQHQIGLEQVMQALQSIRQASSQTNASTRQMEGAASNLSNLSEGLLEAVRKYRL